MFLLQRVRDILLRPQQTWRAIVSERTDAGWVFSTYVMPLAAVAAVAVFIGLTVVGLGLGEDRQRLPLATGLVGLAAGFLLPLVAVYVVALAVNALAVSFGARQSSRRSMMLVAYASTAAFVGALFALVPAVSFIGLLFALYSVYLLYTGLPVLMRCPPKKVVAYTGLSVASAVLTVCALAAAFLLLLPVGRMEGSARPAEAAAPTPAPVAAGAEPEAPTTPEPPRVAALSRSMKAADERLAAARAAGDAPAAAAAFKDMKQAITHSRLPPMDPQRMKQALPNRFVEGLHLSLVQTHSGRGMDVTGGSEVQAAYSDAGPRKVSVTVLDLGPRGLMVKQAEWKGAADKDPAPGHVDKVSREGKRTSRELFRPEGSHAAMTTVLANGIIVEVRSDKSDLPAVKKLLAQIDLNALEAMQRAPGP